MPEHQEKHDWYLLKAKKNKNKIERERKMTNRTVLAIF